MNLKENNKTFLEHLETLRYLIFRIIIAIIIVLPISFYFADDCIQLLVKYSCPPDFTLHYFSLMEPLFVKIKISLLTALFIALPYIAFTVWKFVVPALYPKEKRIVKQLAFSTWILFSAGMFFCFFFIIPAMMRFSLSMQSDELVPAIGLSNYVVLIGMLMLGFGIMFQLPVVVFFLALSGMVKVETIKKLRPIILIAILTLSALLTPPDIFSQLMMAIPTYLLFEISLLLVSMARYNKKTAEQAIPEDIPDSDEEECFPDSEEDASPDSLNMNRPCSTQKRKLRYMSRK